VLQKWHNRVAQALEDYFIGTPPDFSSLPLDLQGTSFQRRVWHALQAIPWGATVSYGELARRLDHPRAGRAVGQAVGANPLPIIIPCHRVIAAGGKLGGYGGGLDRKRWLLHHEGAM
jgi:methylated-DNA-[protein]-cysteine S-methyltransferase